MVVEDQKLSREKRIVGLNICENVVFDLRLLYQRSFCLVKWLQNAYRGKEEACNEPFIQGMANHHAAYSHRTRSSAMTRIQRKENYKTNWKRKKEINNKNKNKR